MDGPLPPSPTKCVYIAHPLGQGEERAKNIERASKWVAWAALRGVCPMASWIILAGQWPETDMYRKLGLAIDLTQIERCDELWLCGPRVSPGMAIERDHALEKGIKVVDQRFMYAGALTHRQGPHSAPR
jgi:hypothetical protein